jgi:peroxiredoxin (alkyl hydroperoxide reductase subunit C)
MVRLLEPAPDFAAAAVRGAGEPAEVRLAALRGRWVVLLFYPRDFTTVCPTEILELSKRMPELRALSAEALAVSVDDVETHRRWIAEVLGPVALPLVADPDRAISRAYGALLEEAGVAARATFVVDPAGVVQYAAFHNLRVGRSISELLRVLEALRTGERAPAEWRPGQPTLGP